MQKSKDSSEEQTRPPQPETYEPEMSHQSPLNTRTHQREIGDTQVVISLNS